MASYYYLNFAICAALVLPILFMKEVCVLGTYLISWPSLVYVAVGLAVPPD